MTQKEEIDVEEYPVEDSYFLHLHLNKLQKLFI